MSESRTRDESVCLRILWLHAVAIGGTDSLIRYVPEVVKGMRECLMR